MAWQEVETVVLCKWESWGVSMVTVLVPQLFLQEAGTLKELVLSAQNRTRTCYGLLIHKLPLPFPRPEGSCSKHKCTSTREASHTHRLQRPSPQCRHRYANRTTTNEPLPPFQTPESRGFQKSLSSPLRPPTVLPCLWGSPASLWGCVWSPAAGGTMSALLEGSNGEESLQKQTTHGPIAVTMTTVSHSNPPFLQVENILSGTNYWHRYLNQATVFLQISNAKRSLQNGFY